MVPAPVPAAPRPDHFRGAAAFRAAALVRHRRHALGLLLPLLILASARADEGDGPIEWKRAFVVGEAAGRDAQNAIAGTDALSITPFQYALLHVVLEGERDGLPVYCLDGPRFRLRGRAIANRMILTPQEAGLTEAEIHWTELRPTRDGRSWVRSRVPDGEARWTLELQTFAPDPRVPKEIPRWGTGRFAAAVGIPGPGGMKVLGSPGYGHGAPAPEPGETPGLRVSRAAGTTLAGNALALSRLPVFPEATAEQVRLRIALRPVDLVLGGYEEQCDAPLPAAESATLTDPAWAWLFDVLRDGIRRRTVPGAPAVGPDARAVPWGHGGVESGDVLFMDDTYAILDTDDGDEWLGEADSVVATVTGEIRRHALHDVGGRNVTILRARDFQGLRFGLVRAGYGSLGVTPLWGSDLFRALREFQHDRGFPVTGVPDVETLAALDAFLANMQSPAQGGDANSP